MSVKKEKVACFFMFATFLIYCFYHGIDEESSIGSRICVWSISSSLSSAVVLFGWFLLAYIVLNLAKKNETVDRNTTITVAEGFLWIRTILFIIPLLYVEDADSSFQVGTIACLLVAPLVYSLGKELWINNGVISVSFMMLSTIVGMQVIYTEVFRNINILSSDLKWWMVIPIGQTNTIGTYLLPAVIICDQYRSKLNMGIKKVIWIAAEILQFYTVLNIGSRSTILLVILYYICRYGIFESKINRVGLRRRALVALSVIILFILVVFGENDSLIEFVEMFNYNSLTQTRIEVYKETLGLFLRYPVLGRGPYSYKVYDAVRTHNFIFEALVENGIIGSFFFFMAMKKAFDKLKENSDNTGERMYLYSVVFFLLKSLIEPTFYTLGSESYFWLIIGLGTNEHDERFWQKRRLKI